MNYHGGEIYNMGKYITDFSTNINPLGVPDSLKKAFFERIDEFTQYPDSYNRSVKKNVSGYLGVKSSRIAVGNGAVDIIYKVAQICGCKKAIIAVPTFSEYKKAFAKMSTVEIETYDFDDMKPDVNKLYDSIEEKSIVILCNPNNPTGSLWEKESLIALCQYCHKKNSMLMIDEAFIEFAEHSEEHTMISLIEKFTNLIIIRAATKFFGIPGIRLGYGIFGNEKLIDKIENVSEPWVVNTGAVIASDVIYNDSYYIEETRKWIGKERENMFKMLAGIKNLKVYHSAANFHLLKCENEELSGEILYHKMIEKGFFIRMATGFYGLNHSYFRLAVKGSEDNKKVVAALKQIFEEESHERIGSGTYR